MIDDIYKSGRLKYPLTDKEYKLLPKVWDFLDNFKKRFVFVTDYREYLIDRLSKYYKPEEFLLYESILSKLFWNLRWLMFPLWTNPLISQTQYKDFLEANYEDFERLPYSLLLCKYQTYKTPEELKYKLNHSTLYGDTYYRSFINKLLLVDQKDQIIITKPMEGSSDIFSKNYFNLLSFHILFDKNLYEVVMKNPFNIRDLHVPLSQFYYQYDYGFPNLNVCAYSFGTSDIQLKRIKKMYYSDSANKAKYWYKIIL